jgi:hypothetical protein
MTIKGRGNDMFQIITSDGVYEIDFDGRGAQLIEKVGETVEVTGYVTEDDDAENE